MKKARYAIQERSLEAFFTLPREAQKQVVDFIAFLQMRYKEKNYRDGLKSSKNFKEEAFIGMWRSRSEMRDSADWVRKIRTGEWKKRLR